MYCIVPLAGPDCYSAQYGIRPLIEINGKPLIEEVLSKRDWFQTGELLPKNLIFVLREDFSLPKLKDYLKQTFPGCKWVVVSQMTKGALLSAAAAVSLIENFHQPIAVDLADLIFESTFSPTEAFGNDSSLCGIIPYFSSDNMKYSYLKMKDGKVLQTAEKQVISNNASAGVYFFRNFAFFLQAIAGTALQEEKYQYCGNLFLCPSFNALIPMGKVIGIEVSILNEITLAFH
jgi:dTDP-glucose pyrophosphorylase